MMRALKHMIVVSSHSLMRRPFSFLLNLNRKTAASLFPASRGLSAPCHIIRFGFKCHNLSSLPSLTMKLRTGTCLSQCQRCRLQCLPQVRFLSYSDSSLTCSNDEYEVQTGRFLTEDNALVSKQTCGPMEDLFYQLLNEWNKMTEADANMALHKACQVIPHTKLLNICSVHDLDTKIIPALREIFYDLSVQQKLIFSRILQLSNSEAGQEIFMDFMQSLRVQLHDFNVNELTFYMRILSENCKEKNDKPVVIDDILQKFVQENVPPGDLARCVSAFVSLESNHKRGLPPEVVQYIFNSLDQLSMQSVGKFFESLVKSHKRHSLVYKYYSALAARYFQINFNHALSLDEITPFCFSLSVMSNSLKTNVCEWLLSYFARSDCAEDNEGLRVILLSVMEFDYSERLRLLQSLEKIVYHQGDVHTVSEFLLKSQQERFNSCHQQHFLSAISSEVGNLEDSSAILSAMYTLALYGAKDILHVYKQKLEDSLIFSSLDSKKLLQLAHVCTSLKDQSIFHKAIESVMESLPNYIDTEMAQDLIYIHHYLIPFPTKCVIMGKAKDGMLDTVSVSNFFALMRIWNSFNCKGRELPYQLIDRARKFLPIASFSHVHTILEFVLQNLTSFSQVIRESNKQRMAFKLLIRDIFYYVLGKPPPKMLLKLMFVPPSKLPALNEKHLEYPSILEKCLKFLFKVQVYDSEISTKAVDTFVRDKTLSLNDVCWAICWLAEASHQHPRMHDLAIQALSEIDRLQIKQRLKLACSLAILGIFDGKLLNSIFNISALQKLQESAESREIKNLQNLNRAVCLEYPDLGIPWFASRKMLFSGTPEKKKAVNEQVKFYLQRCLGGSRFLGVQQRAPYDIPLDFEFCIDAYTKQPVLYVPYKSDNAIESTIQRVGVIVVKRHQMFCNAPKMTGGNEMLLRHMEILGIKGLLVPITDLSRHVLPDENAKLHYFIGKLLSIGCDVRHKDWYKESPMSRQYEEYGQTRLGVTDEFIVQQLLRTFHSED